MFLNIRTILEWRPHSSNFILRNKKKSQGTKSGEQGKEATLMSCAAKNHHCFCSMVSTQSTNYVEIWCMFKSSLRICWHFPQEMPNLPAISEMVSSLADLLVFPTFWSVWPAEGWYEHTIFNWIFPHVWNKKTTHKYTCFPWNCKSCFEHFTQFKYRVPNCEANFNANALFFH